MKKVAIIMGSDSDLPIVRKAYDTLKQLEIPAEVHVYSAHRTPSEAKEFAACARKTDLGLLLRLPVWRRIWPGLSLRTLPCRL